MGRISNMGAPAGPPAPFGLPCSMRSASVSVNSTTATGEWVPWRALAARAPAAVAAALACGLAGARLRRRSSQKLCWRTSRISSHQPLSCGREEAAQQRSHGAVTEVLSGWR